MSRKTDPFTTSANLATGLTSTAYTLFAPAWMTKKHQVLPGYKKEPDVSSTCRNRQSGSGYSDFKDKVSLV
jgi:hypothetical protein